MTDPLIYFLLGTVFGACFLAAMIVRRYERLAFERGMDAVFKLMRASRNRICRRVRFGRNGNLMRWEPL